jgi:ribosomal protein L1, bacterial/chloroplast
MSVVSTSVNVSKRRGSKKYRANLEKIRQTLEAKKINALPIAEAVELLLSLQQPNYKDGPTVEFHAKLNINPTKTDQVVRGSVVLPHGTGKKIKVAAFVNPENIELAKSAGADVAGCDDLIEEIKNSGKVNFDVAIAEPEVMKKLAPIAKILGIAKVMPNPKTGTVGTNITEMIQAIRAGKIDFRNDKTGNVHIVCGKINPSFTKEKLVENIQAVIEAIEKAKPEAIKKKYILSMHSASSISPSIRITNQV